MQMRYFGQRYRCIAFNARGYPPSDDAAAKFLSVATSGSAATAYDLSRGAAAEAEASPLGPPQTSGRPVA